MTPLQSIALTIGLVLLAYVLGRAIGGLFVRSRCCGARVKYVFGWDYKSDGLACCKCGMLQD